MKKLRNVVLPTLLSTVIACSWDINSVDNPHNIVDPKAIETPAGVLGIYKTTINYFSSAYAGGSITSGASFVYASALAGDELISNTFTDAPLSLRRKGIGGDMSDNSISPQAPWFDIHRVRAHLDQAIGGALRLSDKIPSHSLLHMYAMRGYISLFIGELFCSGVPFNMARYGSDIEFSAGLSTEQVFQRAIADFDSALAISTDSIQFRDLASMGKARALLNLDDFDRASDLVQHIPTTFNYQIHFASTFTNFTNTPSSFTLADRLGTNGLDYRSAGTDGARDPRVASGLSSVIYTNVPAKYVSASNPVTLADGLEARLIEAEAMLRNENISGWASKLNELRRQGLNTPMDTLIEDSTVNATKKLREDVMFRERAFWLYVTGRRFGDMRRMVRQYRRPIESVFPIGVHPTLTTVQNIFSLNSNLAPPPSEVESNQKYSGCFNRNA